RAGGLGEVELTLQLRGQPEVVRIAEGEVAAGSRRDAGVAGRCRAAAAPTAHEPHPGVLLGELLDDARGAVRGRVVDDDQLEVPAGLIEYAVDRLTQGPRAVEHRHDDRHQWRQFLSGSHDARSYRCRRMRRPRGPSGLRRTNLADDKAQVPLAPRLTSAESEQLAARSGLVEMGVRPPLGRYAAQVWQRRSFIWNLSASRAYSRNQGSYLGQAWAVLRPILDAGVYVIIFGFLFHSSAPGIDNRAAFIVIGTFTYSLFQTSVMSGLNSIPANLQLIRSHNFPRAVVPLSTVMTETVMFAPILVAMMVVTMVTGLLPGMGAVVPTWSWLLLPFAAVLLTVFSSGLALFFARVGARAPDIANAMPFILTLGRYAS